MFARFLAGFLTRVSGRGLGRGGSPSPRSRGGGGGGQPPPTLSRNLYKTAPWRGACPPTTALYAPWRGPAPCPLEGGLPPDYRPVYPPPTLTTLYIFYRKNGYWALGVIRSSPASSSEQERVQRAGASPASPANRPPAQIALRPAKIAF